MPRLIKDGALAADRGQLIQIGTPKGRGRFYREFLKGQRSNKAFKPEYACYHEATCERQGDGHCGWTQTPRLTACLQNPPAADVGGTPQ